ncbi:hypothetical protein P8H80_004444 [Escherichia coli]|nr:hypothetical protein [Escherichia coli]
MSDNNQYIPGMYAVLYEDNSIGGGIEYYIIACLHEDGQWEDEDGRFLLEDSSDVILKAWPLYDTSATERAERLYEDLTRMRAAFINFMVDMKLSEHPYADVGALVSQCKILVDTLSPTPSLQEHLGEVIEE